MRQGRHDEYVTKLSPVAGGPFKGWEQGDEVYLDTRTRGAPRFHAPSIGLLRVES